MSHIPNKKDLMAMEIENLRGQLQRAAEINAALHAQLKSLEQRANAQLQAMMAPIQVMHIAKDLFVTHLDMDPASCFTSAEIFDAFAREYFERKVKAAAESVTEKTDAQTSSTEPAQQELPL